MKVFIILIQEWKNTMNSEKEYKTLSDFINSDEIKIRVDSNVDTYLKVFNKISKDIELDPLDDKILAKVFKFNINWAGILFGPLWGAWRGISGWLFFVTFASLSILLHRFHPLLDHASDQIGTVSLIMYGFFGNGLYLHKLIKNRNDSIESIKPSKFRILVAALILFGSSAILYGYDTYFSDSTVETSLNNDQNASSSNEAPAVTTPQNTSQKDFTNSTEKSSAVSKFEANWFEIENELITNISGSKKIIVVKIAVMTHYDTRVFDNISKHQNKVFFEVQNVLSNIAIADIEKPKFRNELAMKIKDAINITLEDLEDFGGVEEVVFTSFEIR